MNPQLLILSLGIALAVGAATVGIALFMRSHARRTSRLRLQQISGDNASLSEDSGPIILRDNSFISLPALDAFLQRQPLVRRLDTLLAQGEQTTSTGKFILLMLFLAGVGALITARISPWAPLALVGAFCGGALPVLGAVQKKRRRIAAFEKNFPDSLDILTSALRAGLAFSSAVQVVAEESPEPVSTEFSIVFEENRLGLDMKEALRNLADRVDCAELRMFVTAVILQRETGGNLAEILDGTAFIIRDRFRILGEVRAMTAQQRFSGIILGALPLAMALLFTVTAPDYMRVLIDDPSGPKLIAGAVVLQVIGFLSIRRIVSIKV